MHVGSHIGADNVLAAHSLHRSVSILKQADSGSTTREILFTKLQYDHTEGYLVTVQRMCLCGSVFTMSQMNSMRASASRW